MKRFRWWIGSCRSEFYNDITLCCGVRQRTQKAHVNKPHEHQSPIVDFSRVSSAYHKYAGYGRHYAAKTTSFWLIPQSDMNRSITPTIETVPLGQAWWVMGRTSKRSGALNNQHYSHIASTKGRRDKSVWLQSRLPRA